MHCSPHNPWNHLPAAPDAFVAALQESGGDTLISGHYSLVVLQYLVQRLQQCLDVDPASLVVATSVHAPSAWQELLPSATVPPSSVLHFQPHALARSGVFLGMPGTTGMAMLYATDAEGESTNDPARFFRVIWSFVPSTVVRALELVEAHVSAPDPGQLEALRSARQAFPPRLLDMDRILPLFSDLLGFVAQQHHAQVAAVQDLMARLRWQEDQTRMMVHDIRAPLNNVLISFKALLSQKFDAASQRELLHVAHDSARYLQNVVVTTMDALRLEAGKMPLHFEPLCLAPLVQRVCEPFLSSYAGFPRLHQLVPEDLPLLVADEHILERVLNNLLSNAVKFTPAEGDVTVTAHLSADHQSLELSVADTGRGIEPETQPHIFNRFYQSKDRDRKRGVGLGLYFCRVAVEAHGGTIGFVSTPGEGSTFTVVLPLVPAGWSGEPVQPE